MVPFNVTLQYERSFKIDNGDPVKKLKTFNPVYKPSIGEMVDIGDSVATTELKRVLDVTTGYHQDENGHFCWMTIHV